MTERFYSIREVSQIVGAQPYQIAYLLVNNRVPEPKVRLGGRRAFAADDIQRIAEKLNKKLPKDFATKVEE
jgi:DNA-binding transcriptional MerR regulator